MIARLGFVISACEILKPGLEIVIAMYERQTHNLEFCRRIPRKLLSGFPPQLCYLLFLGGLTVINNTPRSRSACGW